jgi:KaiC/GvpD/RAD55 family RecA-like ATPase
LSAPLVDEGKYGEVEVLIKNALTVSLQRNIGIDYFQDPEARLKLLALHNKPTSTGYVKLDELLAGGLNRKEMFVFCAPPGVGKSLTMSNIAKNLMHQGLNVVYITLELAEEVVAKRFDSMFSGISQAEILHNITKTSIEITKRASENGRLQVKRMPESSTHANHIRAFLKEYEIINGFGPDAIVVDYMDLMCSTQSISAENQFIRDKFISEELRSIANDYNSIMITASQLNRGALNLDSPADIGQQHIAGGISKANTADNMAAIFQTPEMKARGEMYYKMIKTRSSGGVGGDFVLNFNPRTLCLDNQVSDTDLASVVRNKTIQSYTRDKQKLVDLQAQLQAEEVPVPGKMSIDSLDSIFKKTGL